MDSTKRFSNRVDYYVKYRPDYPAAAIDFLIESFKLTLEGSLVADVGAGTGILSRQLLERGLRVCAVEPNAAMQEAADRTIGNNPRYTSRAGTAENTGLPAGALDLIVCAQAFHWFDRGAAGREFHRILKPGGAAVLMWNEPNVAEDEFTKAYEELGRRFGKDYDKINHRQFRAADFVGFFKDGVVKEVSFEHGQTLDREGLQGRVLSSSYMPLPGEPGCEAVMEQVEAMFHRFQKQGEVTIRYRTYLFYGLL